MDINASPRLLFFVTSLSAATCVWSSVSVAACGKVTSIPTHSYAVGEMPETLPPPLTLQALEKFRAELEEYRKTKIEGFNISLQRHNNRLVKLDHNLRNEYLWLSACEQDEFENLSETIRDEIDKISYDHFDTYRDLIERYKQRIEWYRRESQSIRLDRQLNGTS